MIEFTIHAIPVAQPRQRHRVVTVGGRAMAMNYTPARDPVMAFKASCQIAASEALASPLTGPVQLWLTFIFPRPKSLTRKRGANPRVWKTTKSDIDNLQKSLCDALNGIAWVDDSQVCWVNAQKLIAAADELPRVEVRINECLEVAR